MKYSLYELITLTEKDAGSFYVDNEAEAELFTRQRALSHYENFPVGSILIPKKHRNHIFNIYAFARIADDIADEFTHYEPAKRIELLDKYEALLYDEEIKKNKSGNPVFVAIHKTIRERNIPPESLAKLLVAFKRDINFRQAETIDDTEDYCSYSANPVGELVLRVFNLYNKTTAPDSDKICTGLQLANFWQDFSVDIPKGRNFIPISFLEKYAIDNKKNLNELLHNEEMIPKLSDCLNELYSLTEKYLREGSSLIKKLTPLRLRAEIALTVEGGLAILNKVRELGIEVLKTRPKLNKIDYLKIILRAFFRHKVIF